MPPNVLFYILFFWEEVRFASSRVQSSAFWKITETKFIFLIFPNIFDFKIEPLNMASGIWVDPYKEFIVVWINLQSINGDFESCVQVPWLKMRIKYKGV